MLFSLKSLSIVAVAALLFGPATLFLFDGISLSSFYEENVGYRYFYSLRMAFGGEYPWIPQGQLAGLTHVLVQRLLTAAGLPENQLFPRIDLFGVLAIVPPLALFCVAASILARRYQSGGAVLVFAVAAWMLTSPALPNIWASIPEYHSWIVPIAFAAAAWVIKVLEKPRSRPTIEWAAFGLFAGLVVAVKPTLAVFPLLIGSALVLTARLDRAVIGNAILAGLIATLTTLGVLFVYYGASVETVTQHLAMLRSFAAAQSGTLPKTYSYAEIVVFFFTEPALTATVAAPLALGVAAVLAGRQRLAILALVCLPSLWLAFARFYGYTLIEVVAFGVCQWAVAAWLLEQRFAYPRAAIAGAVLMMASTLPGYVGRLGDGLHYNDAFNAASRIFQDRLASGPQPTWILTTSNDVQPISIIGAMCKGALDSPDLFWGHSPYFSKLFPDFRCAMRENPAVSKEHLATVGFAMAPAETLDQATARVARVFSVSLNEHDCKELPAVSMALVYCYPR